MDVRPSEPSLVLVPERSDERPQFPGALLQEQRPSPVRQRERQEQPGAESAPSASPQAQREPGELRSEQQRQEHRAQRTAAASRAI